MATQQIPDKPDQHDDPGCKDCNEFDNATQVNINLHRKVLCEVLYDSKGQVAKAETKFNGENDLYKDKRCLFIKTEDNYQRYRNFEITAGTELVQTNETMKANMGQLKDWNKSLNATLSTLFAKIKDAKGKFSDLKDAAYKLNNSYNEQCNSVQRKVITGKSSENCDDPQQPAEPCRDSATEIDQLVCIPKGLYEDAVSILKASSDVIGVQIFSNIDTLDLLHKDLADKSAGFEKHISDVMKTRKSDLDKLQEELVTSVKSITKAAIDRNTQRANFEGYYDTTEFLCCPPCNCIPTTEENPDKNCDDACVPRLRECEKEICDICNEVKNTFCCTTEDSTPGQTAETNYSKKS
jgi:hypothetical protein